MQYTETMLELSYAIFGTNKYRAIENAKDFDSAMDLARKILAKYHIEYDESDLLNVVQDMRKP